MSGRLLRQLCERQGWRCFYCDEPVYWSPPPGMDHREATFDHVVPYSKGGRKTKGNGVAACWDCNQRRGKRPFQEFLRFMALEIARR